MKQEIENFLEVRESSRAKRPRIRYRRGSFTVVVPEGLEVDMDELIEDNIDWFQDRLEEAREYRQEIPERDLRPGGEIAVLGADREIVVEKRRSNRVDEKIFLAEHLVERTSFMDQLEKSLRSFARQKFEEKASMYVKDIDGGFEKIFVRDQKTRWGSCSSKNNLNFNWRLVLGPEKVLEYVVVHELVHLEVRDHGESFWKRVEEIYPEFEACKEWLEENSARLVFDRDF
ncbi:M48 family metallopeptidase [Candidatus Nanosalina sp. VS9-1]|uniref:M48 family metallopeptidase n=1 Tax=Candidatus Nanosalina sp. VS9-1 TaxID=3388566 RepID=UPI0039DF3473